MKTKRDVVCYILLMLASLIALYFVWGLIAWFITLDGGLWLFTNWSEGNRVAFVLAYFMVGMLITMFTTTK